jgi:hypothetical protein
MSHTRYSHHKFDNIDGCTFSPIEYSKLKFGSLEVAKKFGYDLADGFFDKHGDIFVNEQCVVMCSAYNFIRNASSLLTDFFVERLNSILYLYGYNPVQTSRIHRNVTYTNDYGYLGKDRRKELLAGDEFFINVDYMVGKTLIFIDDVVITGTHEEKIIDMLESCGMMDANQYHLYYAEYMGESPDIEAKLNFANMSTDKTYKDVIKMIASHENELIVRPIKYLLGLSKEEFQDALYDIAEKSLVKKILNASIGENYHKVDKYRDNISSLASNT